MWPLTFQEITEATQGTLTFSAPEKHSVDGVATDSRKVRNGEMFVAIRGEKFDGHNFVEAVLKAGASLALVNADWEGFQKLETQFAERCVRVSDTVKALRSVAGYLRRQFSFPVVAIGGSNGKTTTKEMLGALLSGGNKKVTKTAKSENGYLGLAITLCMNEHAKGHPPSSLVLEIGIDAKGAMAEHVELANPDVALLTALGPEHLAGLDTWETAVAEELQLFWKLRQGAPRIWQCADEKVLEHSDQVRSGDTVVLNSIHKDEFFKKNKINSEEDLQRIKVNALLYNVTEAAGEQTTLELTWRSSDGKKTDTKKIDVPLPGLHNAQNFALACATALTLGRTWEDILLGWLNFTPPDMRSRVINLSNNNVTLYDDCYNASPSSMKAAFEVFFRSWPEKKKFAVLGDMLDLGSESKKWHLNLVPLLNNLNNVHLFLYGDAMYDVFKAITQDHNFVTSKKNVVSYLSGSEDPTKFFATFSPSELSNSAILVKGSRGMDLGRVVTKVTTLLGANS